jgi:SAM-dependent methyltransferase
MRMSTPKSRLQRLFSWLWRRPWFRRQFYNALGLLFRRQLSWQMMNCGYQDDGPPVALAPEREPERTSYALYARLIAGTPCAGRDVLELGAGRGGGARFLHDTCHPRQLVALDYAEESVRWCRRNFSSAGLKFVCGDAGEPRFPDASFDVIVAVEVTHCLADKEIFLAAAARVLRPGGRLLIADFFYRRPDAMHALGKFETALAGSAFTVVANDDWTAGATAAIEADSARRTRVITDHVPRFLQKTALGFASTTASSTYVAMREGRTVYRRYVLEKRKPSEPPMR